jgi:UDP-N-acetyl-D-glucosamine dehydrogenase
LAGAHILLLGLAYKPDVDDDRESPAYALMELFEARGARVDYHDPHVPVIRPTREHPQFAGRKSALLSPVGHDLAVLVTAHAEYRGFDFSGWPIPLVDTRHGVTFPPAQYFQA